MPSSRLRMLGIGKNDNELAKEEKHYKAEVKRGERMEDRHKRTMKRMELRHERWGKSLHSGGTR